MPNPQWGGGGQEVDEQLNECITCRKASGLVICDTVQIQIRLAQSEI